MKKTYRLIFLSAIIIFTGLIASAQTKPSGNPPNPLISPRPTTVQQYIDSICGFGDFENYQSWCEWLKVHPEDVPASYYILAPSPSSATVNLSEFDDVFVKVTNIYLTRADRGGLAEAEMKDLSAARSKASGSTINLSGRGAFSGTYLIDIYNKAKAAVLGDNPEDGDDPSGASLSQVCANKAGIPDRESQLGVIEAAPIEYGRGGGALGLGIQAFAMEPGKFYYLKFDYEQWDKRLSNIRLDQSAEYFEYCVAEAKYFKTAWAEICEYDQSGNPRVKELLTPAQKSRCAWFGNCAETCGKDPVTEEPKLLAQCELDRQNPELSSNSQYYKNLNDDWRRRAADFATAQLNFWAGWIDTVWNPGFPRPSITSGQSWLAYECLPNASELASQPGGIEGNGYFVRVADISKETSRFRVSEGSRGRYYWILKADSGSLMKSSKIMTSILNEAPYFGQ